MDNNKIISEGPMDKDKAIGILGTALYRFILEKGGTRVEKAKSVGLVHSTVIDATEQTFLIHFDQNDSFIIEQIDSKKYHEGSIVYFYDNEEEAIVQATLRDEPLLDFEEI